MTAIYADTSALVKRLVPEQGSAAVRELLEGDADIITSEIAAVELACVVRRRGLRSARVIAEAVRASLFLLPPGVEVIESARLTETVPTLRTLDAVHLATARVTRALGTDLLFLCYDADLAAAAEREGFEVIAPA